MKTNFQIKNYARSLPFIMRLKENRKWPIECRKTKTKVIALTNQNERKQRNKPIRTHSNFM